MRSKLGLSKKVMLSVGSIVFLFFCMETALRLMEITLRLLDSRRENSAPSSREPIRRIHDFFYFDHNGCFRIVPNVVGLHRPYIGEKPILVKINSQGFRGPELRNTPTRRIAFIGDSIVFNGGVEYDQTFVAIIERYLNKTVPTGKLSYECLNLGTTDAGIDQYYLKSKHHVLGLGPEAIVLNFYLNDSRPPQGFLGEDGYSSWERTLRQSIFYRLYTVRMLTELIYRAKYARHPDLMHRLRWVPRFMKGAWVHDEQEWRKLVSEADCDWGAAWREETWQYVGEYLKAIHDLCQSNHIRLLCVCFPVMPQVEINKAFDGLEYPQEQFRHLTERMAIPVYDLLPYLRKFRDKKLFYDQCHLTPGGNRIVAEALVSWLRPILIMGSAVQAGKADVAP
jgi:lysophospholipase L1-like esterase